MQYVNDINRIKGEEVLVREEVQEKIPLEMKPTSDESEVKVQEIEFSWLMVQIIICIIIIAIILLLKEYMPEIYEEFYGEYSKYIEQILLIADGEFKIIDNYV